MIVSITFDTQTKAFSCKVGDQEMSNISYINIYRNCCYPNYDEKFYSIDICQESKNEVEKTMEFLRWSASENGLVAKNSSEVENAIQQYFGAK